MSTKTTFKRIALVAVSALGFGLMSVVPASAARVTAAATPCWVSTAESGVLPDNETATATMSATQVAGAANFVEITCGTDLASGTALVTATGGTLTNFADSSTDAVWTVATGGGSASTANANIASTTFRVTTATAGTVTVVIARQAVTNGAATVTTLQTITITVGAATANIYSAAKSTVLAVGSNAGGLGTGDAANTTTDAAVIATPVLATRAVDDTKEHLRIVVDQEDVNDVNLTTAVANAVTITGVGRVGLAPNTPAGQYVTETAQDSDFYIFSDGRAGQASVAVTVNGVLFKTYIVNFYGAVASLTATTKITHIAPGAATTGVVEVVAKDSLGNLIPGVSITGTASSTTAITAVTAAGDGDSDGDQLVGFTTAATAAGAYTVSFKDGQTPAIVSNTVTFTVAKATAKTVTITTDKATYLPGEKVTVTVTGNDSNGNGMADGTYDLLSSSGITSSVAVQGNLPTTASVALVTGKKTYTIYAPLQSGTVLLTATEGTATDSTTKATVTGSFVVDKTGGETAAEAATDAALEAIDAANAAVDAANQATEAADAATVAAEEARDAADAATAAVEALAADVAKMINEIKAQLAAMAKTIATIAKRVKK